MMTVFQTRDEGAPGFSELEIVSLRRISQGNPTTWVAESSAGHRLHVAYRVGELTVSIHEAMPGRPGAFAWREVLNFHPRRMEAEVAWMQTGKDGERDPQRRHELFREAENKDLAELKAANWGRREEDDRPVLSFGQLRRWLDERSDNLPHLVKHGLAGGWVDIVVTAWGDGT